ncbi:MAG: 5-carboxymethyl-2-hydroxymuconate isomerase [Gammaproteobacteria bacterium]|jgi:5-carboxymethyl-2-hydroxymuconate isomerase
MPHIVIEYSAGVETGVSVEAMMNAAHKGAMASGLFPEYDIKARTVQYENHRTGQTRDSFVHVSIHLLSGRDDAQKSSLAEGVLGQLVPLLPEVVSVGVEIIDMHRESYRKQVLSSS